MMRNKRHMIAFCILLSITAGTVTANLWLPHSPVFINPDQRLLAPSSVHWFGTDDFGRDIFSRTIVAARVSLFIGAIVAIVSTIIGTIIGILAGYYRKADFMLMRFIDGLLAFPSLLLALALVAVLGGSMLNIIIALTLAFFPVIARIVRSSVLKMNEIQYIEAAKVTGVSNTKIMSHYILPNNLTPIIVQGTFVFAKAILAEASLSFLGVGIDPTIPSWGIMLQESQNYISIAPWLSIFPGLSIMAAVLGLNIIGDGLRELLDPHIRRTKRKTHKKNVLIAKGKPA